MDSKCCNPFANLKHNKHGNSNFKKLTSVTPKIVSRAAALNIILVPQKMKICATCRLKIMKASCDEVETTKDIEVVDAHIRMPLSEQLSASPSSSISASLDEFIDKIDFINSLNEILPLIGVTPIDPDKLKKSYKYRREMFEIISSNLARKIFNVTRDLNNTAEAEVGDKNEMLDQLKNKFIESTDKDLKMKILTVLPQSWSLSKIVKEFKTTSHLAKFSKTLVEELGILSTPSKRVGTNVIDEEVKHTVRDFYLSDDCSYTLPGKRDFVTVDENNVKVGKQRRLILMNLAEAYALFKGKNSDCKIGFSKFASLRPPQCVLALKYSGTLSVCVCSYHQNVKLIFEPMKKIFDVDTYHDLISKMICESQKDDCFLRNCRNCPALSEMESYLGNVMEDKELNSVSYKQWFHQKGKNKVFTADYIMKIIFF